MILAALFFIRLLVILAWIVILVNKDGKEEESFSFHGRVNRWWSCWKDDFWGILMNDKSKPKRVYFFCLIVCLCIFVLNSYAFGLSLRLSFCMYLSVFFHSSALSWYCSQYCRKFPCPLYRWLINLFQHFYFPFLWCFPFTSHWCIGFHSATFIIFKNNSSS